MSAPPLVLALAQINPIVGDIAGNVRLILDARARAAEAGADVVLYPELVLSGYPPEDLVLREAFMASIHTAVAQLARATADKGPALIVGTPWGEGGHRFNAAVVLDGGSCVAVVRKRHLPNYGVFDEKRVFDDGPLPEPVTLRGVRLGIMVCEDMWFSDVALNLAVRGAEVLLVPNGSPYEVGKTDKRLGHARARADETGLPLVYVNQIGGQDDLVFDGASFAVSETGAVMLRAPGWRSVVETLTFERTEAGLSPRAGTMAPESTDLEDIYQAMVLGLRDYVRKNGFPGVVLGLSGGIDSALSAAVAVDALGPAAVHCVMMPSPYTSADSLEDAALGAEMLGCRLDEISIGPAMGAFAQILAPLFEGRAADVTEENIQSRIRGVTLMALSNKFGPMLLTTGNKSEMSVGYATLYGDMCGGYSVLKDIYKTTVFALSHWRNAHKPEGALGPDGPVMPERVITKPPTAELRPDQKDEDSLPPYEVLDAVLMGLVEDRASIDEVVARGFERPTVERIWKLLKIAEYKRRQAPPGVKISHLAFGRERRYPITNAFTGVPLSPQD